MAVAHTNVLDLLGKQVSFLYILKHESEEYSFYYSGVITNIVISLNAPVEIAIDDGDFYVLEELDQFTIDSEISD
ncbi:hypothetical protein [Dysgonomonas capnocytophagoides]|uniref:hypothetical protein n=1 Tax=Dysgonomonas capnocytophagoides TaxID=45254 RepID=UPI0033406DC8